MFDRNTVIGLVLSSLLFIAFMYVSIDKNKKYRESHPAKKETTTTKNTTSANQTNASVTNSASTSSVSAPVQISDSAKQVDLSNKYGAFANSAKLAQKSFTIETDLMKIEFSNKGGAIQQVELKKFKTHDKKPLILTSHKDNYFSFVFPIANNLSINTDDMKFETDASSVTIKGDEKKAISFKLKAADGQYIEQLYTISANSYVVDYKVNFVNLGSVLPSNLSYVNLNWYQTCRQLEYQVPVERRYSALYYQNKLKKTSQLDEPNPQSKKETDLEWIAYKQQFFSSILSCKEGMNGTIATDFKTADTSFNKKYIANLSLPIQSANNANLNFEWYLGPNDYSALKKMDKGYENIIPLASTFALFKWMGFVNEYAIIPIFNFLKKFTTNYGIIIFILALIIKLVLTPFTLQQSRQSAIMQLMKPELDELKQKYENDPQKFSAEQMKLMSKVGASPLSGCLPMLLQMPILISMYNFFPASIELRQASFLWANDLSTYDSIYNFTPIFGMDHLSLFTILMTITSLLNAFITPQPQSQDNPGMKYMPYIFPVMLFFMFNSFSAGLTYYYLLFNIFSIAQVWIIKKFFINEEKLMAQIHAKKNAPVKKGGWMEKLENYSKQQQAQLKTQQKASKK